MKNLAAALLNGPIALIAGREFRTYVATASFWIALFIGPLAAAGALSLTASSSAPIPVTLHAGDRALLRPLQDAVVEAARLEGHRLRIVESGARDAVVLGTAKDGRLSLRFTGRFPVSPSGRALMAAMLERELARARTGVAVTPLVAVEDDPVAHNGAWSRFALVAILWLTLTGSLGMLLQAVVRERANRALEGLLAAAEPFEIMAGKILGVGAVSALVLGAWLGSAACASLFAPQNPALQLLTGLGDWSVLLRAVAIYLLAYALYASVTFGVGAAARDVAAAQNLSRPMFVVLLVAFFTSMASATGANLSWLLYIPPLMPFVLLSNDPSAFSNGEILVALALFLAATALTIRLAVDRLTVSAVPARA